MPLPVYYENRLVGYITENGAGLSFAYASEWWTASDTFAVSLTMPLRGEPYPPDIATPWFANLLPEDRLLEPAPFPDFIEPCLASLREKVPAGARYVHELKLDGYRMQAHLRDGRGAPTRSSRSHMFLHSFTAGELPSLRPNTACRRCTAGASMPADGLMAYGPNVASTIRRAASFVDRIIKGTNPADMPIEQPTNFELVINLKTATALGLAVPNSMQLLADEGIE